MAIHIVGSSSGVPSNANTLLLLLDSAADAEGLSAYAFAATGSMAVSADLAYQAIKAGDGAWHQRAVVEATKAAQEAAAAATEAAEEAHAAAQEAGSSAAAEAIRQANEAAEAAQEAASEATTAAQGASSYAAQYTDMKQDAAMGNADMRLLFSYFQAACRKYDSRITALETKVAALVTG